MASLERSLGGKRRAKKSKTKKKIRHTHIEHMDNGGHVVRHSFDQDASDGAGAPPDETHALGDSSALLGHMQDQFGGQLPGAAAAGPGAPAAPPQGGQV